MKKSFSPVLSQLRGFAPAYVTIFAFSFFSPLLYLVTPLYMEQIFDRVAVSRNEGTLWVLTIIAVVIIMLYVFLDYLRSRTLQRLGVGIDAKLTAVVFDALNRQRSNATDSASAQPLLDINSVRDFLSGNMIGALFDAFWSPIFIIAMFLIHPVMGILALVLIAISVGLTILNQVVAAGSTASAQKCAARANDFGNAIFRNTETVVALGMLPRVKQVWYRFHRSGLGWQSAAADKSLIVQAANKFVIHGQIIAIFAVGAILFLRNEFGLGTLIAASIIMQRGLAPIMLVITSWRAVSNFQAAVSRLDGVLVRAGDTKRLISLPRPKEKLDVSRIVGGAPDSEKLIINDVSFTVSPGSVLGIIGPSGAGKSCLARFLIGRWRPRRGQISLGDHELAHWNEDELGEYLGYMPQDIELLPGTVADNISRFDPEVANDSSKLIAAVGLAGIHDLIKELPHGLNTRVGFGGQVLSGGQRQRVALARAVYGNPHLVVLDEPSSSLDSAGETALGLALERLRQSGSVVIVITHKLSLLNYCDNVLILTAGTVQAFGQRAQILERLTKLRSLGAPALTVIQGSGPGSDIDVKGKS